MLAIALILFVLSRYHSPQLAGVTAFLAIFPGLVVSPIAGALLDRRGRVRFITLDYLVATVAVLLIAGLSARQALPEPLLLVIVGVSSLTTPLSNTGLRSLFPIVAPREMRVISSRPWSGRRWRAAWLACWARNGRLPARAGSLRYRPS